VMLINLSQKNLLNFSQVVVSLIIITSLGPCIANLMAIIRELTLTKGLVMRVIIFIASILTGGIVSWVFRLVG
ncbi:MAG: hypothetical protein HQK83_19285, partial [Fibrobacteria bacterium]|nr:hypothetical protein [Fibrobacteria bacterium]